MKNSVLVPVSMWGNTPCTSRPILSAQVLIHSLPSGAFLRVSYSSVTPVKGKRSMTAKASAIFSEAVSSVVEAWFYVIRKTVLFYGVPNRVKVRFFLLR